MLNPVLRLTAALEQADLLGHIGIKRQAGLSDLDRTGPAGRLFSGTGLSPDTLRLISPFTRRCTDPSGRPGPGAENPDFLNPLAVFHMRRRQWDAAGRLLKTIQQTKSGTPHISA